MFKSKKLIRRFKNSFENINRGMNENRLNLHASWVGKSYQVEGHSKLGNAAMACRSTFYGVAFLSKIARCS